MREYSFESITKLCEGKKVLVVACEAGAAQILSSLVKRFSLTDAGFVLEGPAVRIFNNKLGSVRAESLNADTVKKYDLVLTGTSLVPELERTAIKLARDAGIKVCSMVDHWVNYRQRFTSVDAKEPVFPDEIWVCDRPALVTAVVEGLPDQQLCLIENYYFADLKEKSWPMEQGRLLYICEPVFDDVKLLTGDGNAWGYNEFDLVRDFLNSLEKMETAFKKAVLRLHPNEDRHKYDELLSEYKGRIPVEVSTFEVCPIEEECAKAEVVVGVESMALVIALYFERKVFSCLPVSAKRKCQLPHREIQHIHSVAEISAVKSLN